MLRFCILIASFGIIFGYRDGLFDTEDDDVMILNNETFQANVVDRAPGLVWIVQFYNSWCGHCIKFAPTWKRVATDYKDWRDVVVIAVIDCSQTVNLETCRENNITSYPTMKMYPPVNSKRGRVKVMKSQKLEIIKLLILEYMSENAADSWPNLWALKKIEDIWLQKTDSQEHVVMIFEEKFSPVGTQVIFDLRDVGNVLVQRMLKDNVVEYGISKFPSLFKIIHDSKYSLLAIGSKNMAEDRVAFGRVIRALARNSGNKTQQATRNIGLTTGPDHSTEHADVRSNILPLQLTYNSSVVSMQDLESALHYSFRHEVAIKNVIDREQLSALQNFLRVLIKYFPGRKPVRGFLNRVFKMLARLKSHNITGAEWMDKIDYLQDSHHFLPEVIKWESCQGSSSQYRGYPCSMWKLFHTLTVRAYTLNRGKKTRNSLEVLQAIQGYMKHFFGCQECSRNFLWMTNSLEEEVQSHKESVLWLWSAHNRANERLHGDPSEDPEFPKIEFPSDDMCPNCRVLVPAGEGMTYSWDKQHLLTFLVNLYSERNIVISDSLPGAFQVVNETEVDASDKSARDQDSSPLKGKGDNKNQKQFLHLRGQEKLAFLNKTSKVGKAFLRNLNSEQLEPRHVGSHFLPFLGLTDVDLSVCAVFYMVCALILVILCYHFVVRRHKLLCKSRHV